MYVCIYIYIHSLKYVARTFVVGREQFAATPAFNDARDYLMRISCVYCCSESTFV